MRSDYDSPPDAVLMRAFGTDAAYREKLAGMPPLAARMMFAAANTHMSQDEEEESSRFRDQARAMNQALRVAAAIRMRPIDRALIHTRVPVALAAGVPGSEPGIDLDEDFSGDMLPPTMYHGPRMIPGRLLPPGFDGGMVRLASAAGSAIEELDRLEKEAGIGSTLSNFAQKQLPTFSRAGSAVVNKAKNLTGTGRLLNAAAGEGIKPVSVGGGGLLSKVKQRISPTARLQAAYAGAPVPAPKPPAPAPGTGFMDRTKQRFSANARMQAAANEIGVAPNAKPALVGHQTTIEPPPAAKPAGGGAPRVEAPPTPSEPSGGQVQPPQQQPQVAAAQTAAPKQAPAQANAATVQNPTASTEEKGKVQEFLDRAGLSNGGWKGTLGGLAAAGVGAYGLYQGAKAVKDVMSAEPHAPQYNQGSVMPPPGVNQYGYPG
jgi:hypothetical protein